MKTNNSVTVDLKVDTRALMQALDDSMVAVLAEKIAAIAQNHGAALVAEKEQLLDLLGARNAEVEKLKDQVDDNEESIKYLQRCLTTVDLAVRNERDELKDFLRSIEAVSHSMSFRYEQSESILDLQFRTADFRKMERWMDKINEARRT